MSKDLTRNGYASACAVYELVKNSVALVICVYFGSELLIECKGRWSSLRRLSVLCLLASLAGIRQ